MDICYNSVLIGVTPKILHSSSSMVTDDIQAKLQGKVDLYEKYVALLLLIFTSPSHLCTKLLSSVTHKLINESINSGFSGFLVYFCMTACCVTSLLLFFWARRSVHD